MKEVTWEGGEGEGERASRMWRDEAEREWAGGREGEGIKGVFSWGGGIVFGGDEFRLGN